MTKLGGLFFSLMLTLGLFRAPHYSPVDNNDGTVTDERGLMWLQDSHPELGGTENFKSWEEAMEWAETLVFAGYDDWRLPSALNFDSGIPDLLWNSDNNEFGYLYMVSLSNPANQDDIVPMGYYTWLWYWTSTEDPEDSAKAAGFFWSFDGLGLNQMHVKSELMRYTAVRGMPVPERKMQCNDTYDNDSDGAIDYPADWGCVSLGDDSELPVCFELFGRTVCIARVILLFALAVLIVASYYGYRRWIWKPPAP